MLIDITPAEAFELKAIAATRKVLRPIADKVRARETRETEQGDPDYNARCQLVEAEAFIERSGLWLEYLAQLT